MCIHRIGTNQLFAHRAHQALFIRWAVKIKQQRESEGREGGLDQLIKYPSRMGSVCGRERLPRKESFHNPMVVTHVAKVNGKRMKKKSAG